MLGRPKHFVFKSSLKTRLYLAEELDEVWYVNLCNTSYWGGNYFFFFFVLNIEHGHKRSFGKNHLECFLKLY